MSLRFYRRRACVAGMPPRSFSRLPSDPLPALPPYAPIAAMVEAVQAARLKSTVERLVAFGTRNDFSETTSTPRTASSARATGSRSSSARSPRPPADA